MVYCQRASRYIHDADRIAAAFIRAEGNSYQVTCGIGIYAQLLNSSCRWIRLARSKCFKHSNVAVTRSIRIADTAHPPLIIRIGNKTGEGGAAHSARSADLLVEESAYSRFLI